MYKINSENLHINVLKKERKRKKKNTSMNHKVCKTNGMTIHQNGNESKSWKQLLEFFDKILIYCQ